MSDVDGPFDGILALLGYPQSIFTPGRYLTRSGETVTIETIGSGILSARGRYSDGTPERWSTSGRVLPHYLSANDIVDKCTT